MSLVSLFIGWTLGMTGLVIAGGPMFFDLAMTPLGRMLMQAIGIAVVLSGIAVLASG